MKKLYASVLIAGTFILSACSSNPSNQNTASITDTVAAMATDSVTEVSYDIALLDNKKTQLVACLPQQALAIQLITMAK